MVDHGYRPPLYWTPDGRCFLLGRRYHHGLAGLQLLVGGVVLVLTGIAFMADDWHDRWKWFQFESEGGRP